MKVKEGKTGTLYLTAYKNEDEVIIKVSDTGTGMSQEQIDEMNEQLSRYEDSFGYGVRNVNKRIELLFGEGYGLNYQKNDSGGVNCRDPSAISDRNQKEHSRRRADVCIEY